MTRSFLFLMFMPLICAIESSDRVCTTSGCTRAAANLINSIDPSIDPCDDFFGFACGGYKKKNPILDGRGDGVMKELDDRVFHLIQEFLTDIQQNKSAELADRVVAKTYQLCLGLDTDGIQQRRSAIEARGGFPFQDRQLRSLEEVIREQPELPFVLLESDPNDPYTWRIEPFTRVPLNFPHSLPYKLQLAEMIATDLNFTFSREKVTERIEGYMDFLLLITRFYEVDQGIVLGNKPNSWSKEMTVQELDDFLPFLNLGQRIAGHLPKSTNETRLIVKTEHDYYVESVKGALEYRLIASRIIDYLLDLALDQHEEILQFGAKYRHLQDDMLGSQGTLEDWCLRRLPDLHPRWIDAFFMRHVNQERDFGELLRVAKKVKASYLELLAGEKWLSAESRRKVAAFVAKMEFIIGAVTSIWSQEKLNAFYETYTPASAATWSEFKAAAEMFRPDSRFPDAKKNPSTAVKAEYLDDRLVMYLGMIHEPLYAWDYPLEVQYGGLGVVIGHEITHRLAPSEMNTSWISRTEWKTYGDKAECVAAHYENYTLPIASFIRQVGHLTWDEAVSDLMALRTAYRAYRETRAQLYGSLPPKLPGLLEYTNDQLFFIGYASVNCENPSLLDLWAEHYEARPFNEVRVNENAMNSNEFAEAFKCPADSPMNPRKKCQVWRRRLI